MVTDAFIGVVIDGPHGPCRPEAIKDVFLNLFIFINGRSWYEEKTLLIFTLESLLPLM